MGKLSDRLTKMETALEPKQRPVIWTNSSGWQAWAESWEEYRVRRIERLTRIRDEGRPVQFCVWPNLGDARELEIWREVFPDDDVIVPSWIASLSGEAGGKQCR